jgi:hypothetical protein
MHSFLGYDALPSLKAALPGLASLWICRVHCHEHDCYPTERDPSGTGPNPALAHSGYPRTYLTDRVAVRITCAVEC